MKELGGDQPSQLFKPEAIRELFQVHCYNKTWNVVMEMALVKQLLRLTTLLFYLQIEYDTPIARGVRVIPKELPSVIEKIANVTEHSEVAMEKDQ